MTPEEMKVGGRYNWINQPERLIYTGLDWAGYWHQFRKIGDDRAVWCEVASADLQFIEETKP